MNNPFEIIEKRLSNIEDLLLDLKHPQTSLKNQDEQSSSEFLNVEETANFLSLRIQTIYKKVNKNEIPYIKQGKRLYFSKSDLIDWLQEGRVKSIKEIRKESANYFSQLKSRK
jgi:excisionase family DNA binding protein